MGRGAARHSSSKKHKEINVLTPASIAMAAALADGRMESSGKAARPLPKKKGFIRVP